MLGQFFRLTGRGLGDIVVHPWANLLTLVAVAMVSLLAGFVLLGLHNVNMQLMKSRGQVQFQIYWKTDADPQLIEEQWESVGAMKHLVDIKGFTPQDALLELADSLGEAGDFSWLKENNPLPFSALASFAVPPQSQQKGWAAELLTRLKSMPGVDKVHYSPLQEDLAHGWTLISQAVIWPVIGFLGLVVAMVVGNTMRLSLLTRCDEIEILALVGAKPWYIRWPLITGGMVLGFTGSMAGLGLLKLAQNALADILNIPPLFIHIQFMPMEYCAALVGGVTLVAILSSFVAAR
ncbi:cell division protein FtsX [Pseudodesulfovibrio senegalensis]|jgi:cell division transport system permease protein|uniref:Cell division protein FtsX n=1 Tax=Pseudodesulfovibrio senegalensis TaxID=1721087 RepID=A0A6N6N2I5_9BACT|nr:permease-like cell division protein FtsX [Pseudodesulfovibrio senegalensis]KAB1441787.1 FtsX-like permease family protein [Pseudodesulfovibrio senegalensis]